MRALLIAAAAFTLLPAEAALAQHGGEGPPPPRVRLMEAEMREIAPTLLLPATVASRHDSRVASEATGRVTFVAEPGDIIEEGEPIATIDDAESQLRLREAQARARRLEVSVAQLTRDVNRRASLANRGTLPESQLDEVRAQRDMTQQELNEARIAVERAEVEIARASVAAPFTGLVVERLIEIGEYATPGREVARLIDIHSLEARVRAPVTVARYIEDGAEIGVDADGERLAAPVNAVIAAGDSQTRTFEIRVDLTGSPLIVGAPVRVAVPSGPTRNTVVAPSDALVVRSSGAYVMRVDAENVAHRVDVTPGTSSGEWLEVGDAVAEGDRLVVRGAENLRDGQTVNPLGEDEEEVSAAMLAEGDHDS